MEEVYTLGKFSFDTEEEYQKALKELDLISKIKDKYDIYDPEVAKKVLDSIKTHSNSFSTKLGRTFIRLLQKNAGILNEVKNVVAEKVTTYTQPVYFPIIQEASALRNILSILTFGASVVATFLLTRISEDYGGVFLGLVCIWAIGIGISNLCKISKREKEAEEFFYSQLSEEEKQKLENEKETGDCLGFLLGLILVVIMVLIPPLGMILFLIVLFIKQLPKLKWLIKNWKSGLWAFILPFYYMGVLWAGAFYAYAAPKNNMIYDSMAVGSVVLSYFVVLWLINRSLKCQTYLAIRSIASFPIMLFLFILPFALVGVVVYANIDSESSNGTIGISGMESGGGNPYGGTGPSFIYSGEPPQYWVNAPHTAQGGYWRTMPDATTLNNLRP